MPGTHATNELAAWFLTKRGEVNVSAVELAPQLAVLVERAQTTFPGVTVPRRAYIERLAEVTPSDAPLAQALEKVHAADLYLACACALGDEVALKLLHADLARDVERIAKRSTLPPGLSAPDVQQIVYTRLVVDEGPRRRAIASYRGTGALRNWLRAVVVRTAIDLARQSPPGRRELAVEDEELFRFPAPEADPELAYLKKNYGGQFKEAFSRAMAALTPRERNLLRQHLVYGMTIDDLGTLYAVHRATAARQLAAARQALLSETRKTLQKELGIGRDELVSIMRLIDSQLDLSIGRLLRTTRVGKTGDDPAESLLPGHEAKAGGSNRPH